MGKPEPDPFPEPEKPWPIDPRPAIRDLKKEWADLRTHGLWRDPTRKPTWYWAIYAIALLLLIATMYYLRVQSLEF